MHKVRNRKGKSARAKARARDAVQTVAAPRGHPAVPSAHPAAAPRSSRDDIAFMLRQNAASPIFPADLIVPPHRGAVITTAPWPQPAKAAPACDPVMKPAPAQSLPPTVMPVLATPEPAIPAPLSARPLSALSESHAPIPASRALVPRRQGFIDVLAFALRDSGRRLARWSSARRRAEDMKDKLAKAEARMRAMEAQLAALRAIQERVRP
eukprot:gene1766-1796_t